MGSAKGSNRSHAETDIRNVLRQCINNDTLYYVLGLKNHYSLDDFRSDLLDEINNNLTSLEGTSMPKDLKAIHPQADEEAQKLLKSNLSSYDSSLFTQHICRQLVPEPKPGPLPEVIRNLESLAGSVGSGALLQNQAIHLRAFLKNLAEPLLSILEGLLQALKDVDKVLTAGSGSFKKNIGHVLAKIKEGDEFLSQDMKKFSRNINEVVESSLDGYIRSVDEVTKDAEQSCRPRTLRDSEDKKYYTELCNHIVKPIVYTFINLVLCLL